MALSDSHIGLVRALESFVNKEYGADRNLILYTDNPDPNLRAKVPSFGGFLPDLYARCYSPDLIIIGEAKTVNDVDSRHSIIQYERYLNYCARYSNTRLIFAVPWTAVPTLKNKIRIIKRRLHIDSVNLFYIEPLPE